MPTLKAAEQPHLNAEFLRSLRELTSDSASEQFPEKVLQFGEGGFLRGFVDWMIHGMNQKGLFWGSVVVVQPIAQGQVEKLNEQSGAYTLLMRSIEEGTNAPGRFSPVAFGLQWRMQSSLRYLPERPRSRPHAHNSIT